MIPTPGSAPSAQAEADAVGAALLLIVGGIALAMLVAALHRSGSPPVRLILGLAWALQLVGGIALIGALVHRALKAPSAAALLAAAAPILFFGYSAVRLATSVFSEDDEIYSWNLWAIQHFLGLAPDFHYTSAPYPQGFSLWIASVYGALGGFELQSLARLTIALSTLLYFAAMFHVCRLSRGASALAATVAMALLWFPIGLRREFPVGLADPPMAALLMVSVALTIRYAADPQRWLPLAGAALAAIAAAYTKQAALIWGCFSFPLVMALGVWRLGWPRRAAIVGAVAAAACLLWPLVIGAGFENNQGVLTRSLGSRSLIEQLQFAAGEYLLGKPAFLLMLLLAVPLAMARPVLRWVCLLFLAPGLLSWFVWGAYDLRLGIHVVGVTGLLLVAGIDGVLPPRQAPAPRPMPARWRAAGAVAAVVATLALAGWRVVDIAGRDHVDLANGPRQAFRAHFNSDGDALFSSIVAQQSRVWSTSNYAYGLVYGHTSVGRPDYARQPFDRAELLRQLVGFRAQMVIDGGKVAFGPAAEVLRELLRACPGPFTALVLPPNRHDYAVHAVDIGKLEKGECTS